MTREERRQRREQAYQGQMDSLVQNLVQRIEDERRQRLAAAFLKAHPKTKGGR